MIVYVVVFIVFALIMAAMAVGVMMGRSPLKGSCGGLGALGVEKSCGCTDACKNEVDEQLLERAKETARTEDHALSDDDADKRLSPGNKKTARSNRNA